VFSNINAARSYSVQYKNYKIKFKPEAKKIIIDRDIGKNLFHVKNINWSYRIRGNLPRIQINKNANIVEYTAKLIWPHIDKKKIEKNKDTVSILIINIIIYSAINRRAKPLLLYSILNPDTISDSPSAKSKGARLVSAKIEINHTNRRCIIILEELIDVWKFM